jgi:hypothetical protein
MVCVKSANFDMLGHDTMLRFSIKQTLQKEDMSVVLSFVSSTSSLPF